MRKENLMKTELGKITNVYFGHGGYQDAMIGIKTMRKL